MPHKKFSDFIDGNEMQIGDQTVGLRSGDNYRFDFPGNGIKDGDGNYLFQYASAGASAVNYLIFSSSVATSPVIIASQGTDTDVSISLAPKGAGILILDGLNWPHGDGPANYVIGTNGAGQLSFMSPGSFPVAPGAANTILISNGAAWVASTPTYLNALTANLILYASASNTLGQIAGANGGVMITDSGGVPSWLANPTATGRMLTSVSGGASVWSTATFPGTAGAVGTILRSDGTNWIATTATFANTYGASTLLYSNGANTVTGLATANSAVLVTNSTGVPAWSSTMTNGQLIIGSTGGTPTAASLTAGTGVTITPGAASITISATGGGTPTVGATGTIIRSNGAAWVASTATFADTYGASELLFSNGANTVAGLTTANGATLVTSATGVPSWLANPGASGRIYTSVSGQPPAWSTATFPATAGATGTVLRSDGTNWIASTSTFADTYGASTLLYSNGANTVTGLATANSAVLVTGSTGVPVWSSTMTNGQVIIGSTGATPVAASLTAGTNVTITPGAGTITISSSGSGSGYVWTEVTGTSASMAVNNAYIASNVALVTLTLPSTAAVGDCVQVQGKGAGGWLIAQNSGQTIHFGNVNTTTGVGGSLASTNRYDSIEMVCITANTDWAVLTGPMGSITVV